MTKGRGSGNNRWRTSSRTHHKPGQSLKRAGEELGRGQEAPAQRLEDARPAPRTTQTPTPLAGLRGGAPGSHWLELLRATPPVRSLCLECHQSFLLCVLDLVQGSLGSCGLGHTGCPGWVGRQLPLWTRATPSWTRTHPLFPGAYEDTRLALQPNSRQADLYEYVQGPGILACLPHSIWNIIGGGCATALPEKLGVWRELSKFSSRLSREPWDRARPQHYHFGAALMA